MRVSSINNVSFQHKIILDIGASNPKGTLKIAALTDDDEFIYQKRDNSYLNSTIDGFENSQDFINKIGEVIKKTHQKVLSMDKRGKFSLAEEDKKLSGVVVFVPGTTVSVGKRHNKVAFMPNLKDKNGHSLTHLDFASYEQSLKNDSSEITGITVNPDKFKMTVTKDLGGTGIALAKMMAERNMLKEGDYVMGIMTGGGFGSVDIKVKNGIVEFETSESSSYVSGNYKAYGDIADIIEQTINDNNPQERLKKLRANYNQELRDNINVLGKLGRQGVSVKSHIDIFCRALGRSDLAPILQATGDARIVEMNRLCVSLNDEDLLNKIREYKDELVEIPSTTIGKAAFKLNEEFFGENALHRARTIAINDYANSVSLISINKINDCINKVVLLGPFAHGVDSYIKENSKDFCGAKNLPQLILQKIKTNINNKHVDLPTTFRLMNLYDFEIICNDELNIPDNTFAGNIFLNPKFEFVPNRGSWFNIPLDVLKAP